MGIGKIDTLVGSKSKDDPVLLTFMERKARFEIMFKIYQKSQQNYVDEAMKQLYERLGDRATSIFKTMTSDNGSEFAGIYEMLTDITDVYFAHPYASYERGAKENQHNLIRGFIPKGKRLADISANTINQIQQWINNIPRKILDYLPAKEAFINEIQSLAS